MTRVIVTGGSGFIGTNLVELYVSRGDELLNIDVAPPRNREHERYWRRTDILDRKRLLASFREFQPELVMHMAARTDLDGASVADYAVNVQGVANVVEACRQANPSLKRVVFASSQYVCRLDYAPCNDTDYMPHTAYGESKVAGEKIVRDVRDAGFAWVIVRPTSIWGPWFDVPYKGFFTVIDRGLYLHPRGERIRKCYGFVGNTVYQLDRLASVAREQINGRTLFLADYPSLEVREWAEMIRRELCAGPVHDVPLWFLKLLAAIGDGLKAVGLKNVPLTTFRLANLLTPLERDVHPLKELCGPLPYSVEEGVRQTVTWLRMNAKR